MVFCGFVFYGGGVSLFGDVVLELVFSVRLSVRSAESGVAVRES